MHHSQATLTLSMQPQSEACRFLFNFFDYFALKSVTLNGLSRSRLFTNSVKQKTGHHYHTSAICEKKTAQPAFSS